MVDYYNLGEVYCNCGEGQTGWEYGRDLTTAVTHSRPYNYLATKLYPVSMCPTKRIGGGYQVPRFKSEISHRENIRILIFVT